MKIIHVVPHVNEEAAGPSYSVPRLCESLAALGHDIELSCLAARGDIRGVRVDLHAQWPIFGRFAVSTSHARALRRKAHQVDIVHNHSLWSMVNVASGWVVPGRRAKLVTSPRGTLSGWALARRRYVKCALWPFQRPALARASMLHATSEEEYREIRGAGFRAPVAIIPNGIDIPVAQSHKEVQAHRTLLFLSRIHPKKGIDRLFHAWAGLQTDHSDWKLRIVGRGEPAHEREMRELAAELALQRVEIAGALYGNEKSRAYFDADLFVLPSHSENFGMSVAEALAHGCPVVVGKGAPWSGLRTAGCGWWVESNPEELVSALNVAMSLSATRLGEMGRLGRAWMERDFAWLSVARRMAAAYGWLLGRDDRPEFVHLN